MYTFIYLITLIGCVLLAIFGLGMLSLAVYGAIYGMHGGPIIFVVMVLFGGAVAFLGFYLGRITLEQLKGKSSDVFKH